MEQEALKNEIYRAFPTDSIGKYDLLPIFADNELFGKTVEFLAEPFIGKVDFVTAPEAMGFILGTALARRLGAGFIALRKESKLPYEKSDVLSVKYKDYSGSEKALEIKKGSIPENSRVLICDDWIATGSALTAALKLTELSKASLAGIAAVGSEYNTATKDYIDNKILRTIICEED